MAKLFGRPNMGSVSLTGSILLETNTTISVSWKESVPLNKGIWNEAPFSQICS